MKYNYVIRRMLAVGLSAAMLFAAPADLFAEEWVEIAADSVYEEPGDIEAVPNAQGNDNEDGTSFTDGFTSDNNTEFFEESFEDENEEEDEIVEESLAIENGIEEAEEVSEGFLSDDILPDGESAESRAEGIQEGMEDDMLLVGGPLFFDGEPEHENAVMASINEIGASSIKTNCTVYNGSNVEYQNYRTYASPVTSYLTIAPQGGFMRVQAGALSGKLLIEYYDYDFNIEDTVTLDLPYPRFGGFYEDNDAYYVLTGQNNPNESNSTVVFSVSKYTKSWQYIASAGLSGANTVIPFDAGSARFATSGQYLLIRTCHEMYRSSDGFNHQANVTIQIDKNKMEVTDSYTIVMNVSTGYVSHSFNQFILAEGDKMIGLDHGDAYPRSIVMVEYPNPISGGKFVPGWNTGFCKVTDIITFSGATGANYTGASVGGFASSSSHYLVAGNLDDSDNNASCRNVFIAAVPKSGGDPVVRFATSYSGSGDTASTPHLVKLDSDRFLLMWSSRGTVYYITVNGSGQTSGPLYSFKGNLSDCVPHIAGDQLVWYTWNNETVVFYKISVSDISKHDATIIINGHKDVFNGKPVNGVLTGICSVCGRKADFAVPTSIKLWWRNQEQINSDDFFWNVINTELKPGDTVQYSASFGFDSDLQNQLSNFQITNTNADVISVSDPFSPRDFLKADGKKGMATLTFQSYYNPDVSIKKTFYVNCLNENSVYLETSSYTYNGKEHKPKVSVSYAGKTLSKGKDYQISFSDNVHAGKAKVTVTGIGDYTGTVTKTFRIYSVSLTRDMFSVPSSPLASTGKALKPKVRGTFKGTDLKEGTDYKIVSYSSNVKPGTGYVRVSGIGDFKGSVSVDFTINKASGSSSSGSSSESGSGSGSSSGTKQQKLLVQPMTVSAKAPVVKAKKLKNKNQTIKKSKAFKISNAQGTVSFAKQSGSKNLTISSKGKITVEKGTKKGTYKIKVKVTASGNNTYKAGTKTVIVKVKVA